MDFLKVLSVRYMVRYLYGTTLRTDVEEWHGLGLEYAACREDYRTVFIRFVLRESRIVRYRIKNKVPYQRRVTQYYICGPGVGAGWYAANAVEYCTLSKRYDTIKEQYDTAFRNTATSNIATVAYGTRTVFNTENKYLLVLL